MQQLIISITDSLTTFASNYLILVMFVAFVISVGVKMVIHYIAKSYNRFAVEFEKRVHRHLEGDYPETKQLNFQELTKNLLERTYHEAYVLRELKAQRNMDKTTSLVDRILLVEEGVRKMIFDTLKQVRYYKKGEDPNFQNVTKFVFGTNNYMNNFMNNLPVYVVNNFLNILPGLFIIGGIFGTFLGITKGIPELKGIDPSNLALAKSTMGVFLDKMSFSMNTSLFGIGFSVFFTVLNNLFSENKLRVHAMERFFHGVEFIWKDTKENTNNGATFDMADVLKLDTEENSAQKQPDLPSAPPPPPMTMTMDKEIPSQEDLAEDDEIDKAS